MMSSMFYEKLLTSFNIHYLLSLSLLLLLSWMNVGETRRGELNNFNNLLRRFHSTSNQLSIKDLNTLNESQRIHRILQLKNNFQSLMNATTYYQNISSSDSVLKKYYGSKILERLRRSYLTNFDNSDQTIYYIQKKPQIIEEPKSAITIVGQSVLFVCLVEGNPAPKVQWKVSGTSVSESRFGKTFRAPRGSILRVNNALPIYNGAIITCTATNALGQAESSATLTVIADESNAPPGYPRFLNSFSVIVARKNAEVELECRATGDPMPEITWFKDSVPIDLSNPRYKKLDIGNLRIQNLIEEDEGKYECEAKNDKGTRLSSGDNLLVRENVEASLQMLSPSTKRFRPHFTNIPGSRQIIPPGGQLTLSCTAVGAPVPNVQWFRDQQHLPGDQLNKQPPGTAKLTLTNLLESFNVTCIAESTMGRIYHEVQIIVKNLPNPPGDFQIIEISATHARIAMKPSNSSLSAVRNYLILWLPSSQFTNQTLYELSQQANILISQPPDQTEPLLLSNNEDTRPNLIMLPKILKNISRSSLTSQYSHQTIRDLDINQQTTETINPTFMYNILMISLTQLKPYTEYTLWARTVGPDGDTSLPNKPFLFTTKELAPSSPPLNVHAQALSNAAVTVYWDPPLEPNGRIRAYRIYYTHNPTLEFSYWDTSIVNLQALQSPSISTATIYNKNTNNLNVDSDEQTNIPGHLSILSHLTTNATYYIRVSAVNGQGEGPASDILVVIVRPGVLSKPQNFTAITKSSHEILLTWKPPNDVDMNTRPLEYYELEYEPISDYKMSTDRLTWLNVQNLQGVNKKQHLSSIRIMSDITTYLLNNLEPDTRYLFNLVAVSKAGHGVRASTFARTNQFIPSAPTNLSVEAISPTQLQVKWKHPLINNQLSDDTVSSTRIAYYDLNWRQSDSEGSWSRSDVPSGNHHSQTWFNLSSSASSLTSSTINNGLFETNTFGSLQIPSYNNFNENFTNSINSWYIANITGLQPSTYYVIHLRAVSPSGTGDTATSRPVKTWNEPPPAPQKLRLISQIIPQPSSNLPPQILLRISWEPVWYDDYSTLSVDEKPVSYRIRWRLIGGERNLKKKLQSTIQRSIRSIDTYSSESTLHWPIIDSKQQHHSQPMNQFTTNDVNNPFQSDLLIPTKLLNGEVNVTETSWNAASDIFLLGMSYEFRVAVITPLQVGYEALETVSFEGTAPTNTPTSIHVSYILDQIIISWNPPDWDHRHGIFEAYELKCYHSRSMNVNNSNEIINKHYEEGLIHYNVTLLNSRVQWPISAPNDLLNIIPWPSGQIQLNIPMKLNYYYYGKIDENDNNERSIKYTYACIIRAINVYGFGPWSTEKIILPKKTFIPPPPENIRAIFLHQHQLRISWSLPVNMLQSISSNLIKKLNQREINNLLIYSGNSYSHFAIYISPKTKTNWKRYTTKGPTTELVLDDYNEDITYLVRVSTVSINEHESKWSDAISTQRIQSSTISMLAIKVYHLKCYLFYRSETDLWQLQLKWEVPKQLQTDPYFDQLSHYRINYTMMKTNLKYITTHSVINRESSLNKLDEYKNKFILEHSLYTSESNSIYAVSIRPVFKGISSQTDTSIYVNRPYGIVENNFCYIPRNDILHVPVPVILLNPFIDKHTNHFLIGLKPIQWIHTSLSHSAGAAASTASLSNQDILMRYELVAYKLPIHQSIQYVEQLKLGQWNSTDLFIHSTSQSNQVHIELSQPLQDTSLRYEKRSAKLFVGKALPLNQDYALCIKVCLQPNQQFYSFNIMDNGVKHEPICYESKWIQPVSTNRPSPSLDSFSDSIDHLFNGSLYDPDRLIWESKSFGTHSPPPSDDATAQEPNRVNDNENHQLNEILHKYHQLPQVTIKQTDDVINRSVLHKNLLLSPSVTRNPQITLLTIGVTLTAIILILGLICFFIILYRKKYFTELNKYNLTDDHKSSIHSPWKQRYQLSYTIWHRLTLNKQKSNKKLFNLTEMHSPPPGSDSIVANLHSTLTSYSIGLIATTTTTTTTVSSSSSSYEYTGYTNPTTYIPTNTNDLLYSHSNGEIRNFINHSLDGMYSNEQFDSLRIDTLRNEMNSNYVTDSPNTNDNYTTTRLNRVDSISSSYRPYQINSPPLQLSTLNNGIYGTHCMKSNQNEFNGLGGLGSLKSVSTMGSKSLQPINTIDSINVNDSGLLSSPISNGHCRNLLNGQQTHRPIQVANLIEHVQNLKADNGRLMAAEFESIDPGGPFTWEHSNRPSNRNKNRYANVIAYDHSRVVLQLNANNDPDSDYINANYLDGYRKQNAYIATQGPLPHTITDFWRMVWEQRSRMIVSMTRLEEKARIKCEQYWPSNFSTGSGINSSNSHSNMNGNNNNNNSMMMSCRPSPSISSRLNSTSYNKKLNDFILKLGDKSILPPPMNFRTSINLKEIHGEQHVDEYNGDDNNNQMINGDLIFTNGLSHLSHSTINFGEISVSLLDTIELAYYTVRSFVLQKVGTLETREVRQLQFTAWPDHGVPNHPAPLLMFLRRVRAECPTDSGPIIVHCSAGVGRTGAFILLDILLEQMRHEKAVDVFNTVSRLRAQRNFMVQTEDQYAFIYEALVEAASSGNTEIPVHQLNAHWFRLTDINQLKLHNQLNIDQLNMKMINNYTHSMISTGLELEFYQLLIQSNLTKLISSIPSSIGLLSPIDPFSLKTDEKIFSSTNFNNNSSSISSIGCSSLSKLSRTPNGLYTNKSIAAMLPVNLPKNRNLSIIPHDANRVVLRAVRGVEGSDYINASYIDGYKSRAGYIATQAPLMNTLEDFWRMIWESGSCLIVKLDSTIASSELKFVDSPTYWPNLQSARHGFLVIDPIAIYTMPAYIMRELRLTDTRDGSTRTVRQFDASSTADALIHLERQTCIPNKSNIKSDFNEFMESSRSTTMTMTTTTTTTTATSPTISTTMPTSILGTYPLNSSVLLETSFTEDDYIKFNQIPTNIISTFRQCYQPLCEAMLELISQVHKTKEHFGIDGPITVHCNWGSGLTGVFLTISLVLERMRYEGVVDMFQTVKLLRWQRSGLVQTVSEYAFCYATALEYLESFERYAT